MKKKLAECLVFWGILLVVFPVGISSVEIEKDEVIWGTPKPIDEIIDWMYLDKNNCRSVGKMAVTDLEDQMIIGIEKCRSEKERWDLWRFTRGSKDDPWGNGVNLNDISTHGDINTGRREYNPTMKGDGTLLIWESDYSPLGKGKELWQSKWEESKAGKWGEATVLVDINSDSDDSDPAISTDGNELYFASNRPGSIWGGKIHPITGEPEVEKDIWVSHWDPITEKWKTPENLNDYNKNLGGPAINTGASDEDPTLSSDGLHLFFASDRGGDNDIYWYSRKEVGAPWGAPFDSKILMHPGEPINTATKEHGMDIVNDTLYIAKEVSHGTCHPYVVGTLAMIKTTIVSIGSSGKAERTVMLQGGLGLLGGTFVPMHWSDQKGVPEQYLYLINSED